MDLPLAIVFILTINYVWISIMEHGIENKYNCF